MEEKVLVLDTSGFIAKWPLYAPRVKIYTTSLVLREVKDAESRQGLELAFLLNRVEVLDPGHEYIKRAVLEAQKRGLLLSLSDTDLSIAALALQLKDHGYSVEVMTDDYALQNLVSLLGLSFRPLRTRGIKRVEEYMVICPACGYRSRNLGEKVCPICGTPLQRVRRRRKRKPSHK